MWNRWGQGTTVNMYLQANFMIARQPPQSVAVNVYHRPGSRVIRYVGDFPYA
jgi:hypothetical protein